MALSEKELAAAVESARGYPPGFGFRWGHRGWLVELDTVAGLSNWENLDREEEDWQYG